MKLSRRRMQGTGVLLVVAVAALAIGMVASPGAGGAVAKVVSGSPANRGRSSPFVIARSSRPAIPGDHTAARPGHANAGGGTGVLLATLVDTVLSNTDPNLKNTETFGDGEPSIAINPVNPNQVAVLAFSGCWDACATTNSPIWQSINAGQIWTKYSTIPKPPMAGTSIGCPCDQTPDFNRSGTLSATYLFDKASPPGAVYTGSATDPSNSASFSWHTTVGVADKTNTGTTDTDQPWLRVAQDTTTPANDDVFVAYDDFSVSPIGMHVTVSTSGVPPFFGSRDAVVGTSANGPFATNQFINPGLRLAPDPRNGTMYALWQTNATDAGSGRVTVDYMLNRSTNSGQTWTLNGSSMGTRIATATTIQGTLAKFGTTNALLGGIDSAAVDPTTGDLYFVYGAIDSGTGKQRLAVARVVTNGAGAVSVASTGFVTGQVNAALPSIAITSDGTIAVLYDSFDGIDPSTFPRYSAHLALSTDHGATVNESTLLSFLSSSVDNGDGRQRVLGDYQQMKAIGQTLYGVFSGNGAALGRSSANMDPIFFSAVVDNTPPSTGFNTQPPPVTNNPVATFSFTASDAGTGVAGFRCSLDGAAAASCSSPFTTRVADGAHVFIVAAIDRAGNVDPTGQTSHWLVDTIAPRTVIASAPADPAPPGIPFAFVGDDGTGSGVQGFACTVDGGAAVACASSQVYAGLRAGRHTLIVKAIDRAGNSDATGAAYAWTILTRPPTAPVILVAPDTKTGGRTVTIAFADRIAATFVCRVDARPSAPCASPLVLTRLSAGAHRLLVHAVDGAERAGGEALVRFTIGHANSQPPPQRVVITSAPTLVALATQAQVGCRADHGLLATCSVTAFLARAHGHASISVAHGAVSGASRSLLVRLTLTARGRALAALPGGVRVRLVASATAAGTARRYTTTTAAALLLVTTLRLAADPLLASTGAVRASARSYLDALAATMVGARSLRCTGNTDSTGSATADVNRALASAQAVCSYLARRLPHVVAQAQSVGATRPVRASGAANRYVDITASG